MAVEPSEAEICGLLDELDDLCRSNLIGALQEIQGRYGYLPRPALAALGRRARVPLSRIWGIVTFYSQFYTEPRGRHTIRCCRGTACHVKGADRILDTIRSALGIQEGESTPDRTFHLETVACLGTCFLAPVMMVDSHYFGNLTPQKVEAVLRNFRDRDP